MSGWDKIKHLPHDDPRKVNARTKAAKRMAKLYAAGDPRAQGGAINYPDPKRLRANYLRRTYKISPERYDELYRQQGGRCAICLRAETGTGKYKQPKVLAVDHCHTTKAIRGLLCSKCNPALGLLDDDILRLKAAISYLQKIH